MPLSLWPHLPEPPGATAPDCAVCAWAVVTSFSSEGDVVVVPDARTHVVLTAAALARRRALGLCGDAWQDVTDALGSDLPLTYRLLATARTSTTAYLLHPACREAGRAALAVTTPGSGSGAGDVYAACERALRPGGVLAVITTSPITGGRLRDLPGEVTTHARPQGPRPRRALAPDRPRGRADLPRPRERREFSRGEGRSGWAREPAA
ncbi:MAG TPA: hypothetical protein VNM16_09225 [Bacillota bacterium]|nr:hypothetical protein [Bacillota bacterium]